MFVMLQFYLICT